MQYLVDANSTQSAWLSQLRGWSLQLNKAIQAHVGAFIMRQDSIKKKQLDTGLCEAQGQNDCQYLNTCFALFVFLISSLRIIAQAVKHGMHSQNVCSCHLRHFCWFNYRREVICNNLRNYFRNVSKLNFCFQGKCLKIHHGKLFYLLIAKFGYRRCQRPTPSREFYCFFLRQRSYDRMNDPAGSGHYFRRIVSQGGKMASSILLIF